MQTNMEYNREMPRYIYIGSNRIALHMIYENVANSRKKSWLWAAHYKPNDGSPGRYFSETTIPDLQHRVWSWIFEQDIQWDE